MARAGDVIGGKYRLVHPLGIGGMGAVWRAEHTALRQQVAIKLLDVRGPAADRSVKRFQREAQIAASIRHRNIVYISDFGTDGGAPYLVMELLVGVPLSERIVVGEPLSVGAFLRMMCEVLEGLTAVHEAGVVHRDMKPENIFLVRDGITVFPKLLDFGVSRSTERNQGHTITREGIVMGTPEYVSPEQARGRMADARSDIYSLGVVIYEALAGRLPFQADNAADLIVAVLNADAIPLGVLRPDLGEEVSQIVGKAMSRNPEERFHSAEEMRSTLDSYLERRPHALDLYLPRRFVAPATEPTPLSSESQAVSSQFPPAPFRASKAPSRAAAGTQSRAPSPGTSQSTSTPTFLKSSRKRLFGAAAGVLAAVVALMVLSVSSSEPSTPARAAAAGRDPAASPRPVETVVAPARAEVTVELFNVPPDATVLADGAVNDGSTIKLPRDSGMHEITVRAEGREPWTVQHDAARDGRYALSFEPLALEASGKPKAGSSSRAERSSSRRERAEGEPSRRTPRSKAPSLVRTPDF